MCPTYSGLEVVQVCQHLGQLKGLHVGYEVGGHVSANEGRVWSGLVSGVSIAMDTMQLESQGLG